MVATRGDAKNNEPSRHHRPKSQISPKSLEDSIMASSPPTPSALPTAEAIEILLSPDGYYKYLGIPRPSNVDVLGPKFKEAMSASESNDDDNNNNIDLDQVKKNYRRLSLRHHPDRKTGDAETFRMLNRAKVVLSNAKLRREYDLVGLDLDDDAEDHAEDGGGGSSSSDNSSGADSKKEGGVGNDNKKNASTSKDSSSGKDEGSSSKTETVMSHLASVTLAAIMQIFVRTGLLGTVSVLISRYIILTLPAMGVLAYISYKIHSTLKATLKVNKLSLPISKDALSPLAIAFGLLCMYRGRLFAVLVVAAVVDNANVGDTAVDTAATTAVTYLDWSWTFWLGEALVMTMFLMNSFDSKQPRAVIVAFVIVSLLFSLWLRGRFWRYATILFFEAVIAALCVLVFPIMEMILESIVEDKMRKVGEKIRAHDQRMKELLRKKKKEQSG